MAEQPQRKAQRKAPPQPKRNPVAENAPWKPCAYGQEEVGALQALVRGNAAPHQQKLAIDWIINVAAGTYDAHYFPGERDTAFALGRAYVGQQCVKLIKTNPAIFKRRT